MEDVVVFAALHWEAGAVLPGLSAPERVGASEWRGHLGDGASCRVVVTGVGGDRAAAAAERAPDARLAMVVGCAGGVVPEVRTGDLVVGSSLAALGRDGGRGELPTDCGGAIAASLAARGIRAHRGPIGTADAIADTAAAKAVAAAAGALVVEMESVPIATIARRRGMTVAALRVVLDEAGQAVPLGALGVDEAGRVSPLRAAAVLAVRPDLWPAVARLARQRRLAERRLREGMAVLLGGGLDAFGLTPSAAIGRAMG